MKRHLIRTTIAFVALNAIPVAAHARFPAAAEFLPSGFQLVKESNIGGATIVVDATKANENFPKPHMDQGIQLRVHWGRQAMTDMVLDMLAKQPEDPSHQAPGSVSRDEPCGRQRYKDGVLICRKIITKWVGSGDGPDLVTWSVSWTGKVPDGLVGVGISNLYGSKGIALGWIDAIIPTITKETGGDAPLETPKKRPKRTRTPR